MEFNDQQKKIIESVKGAYLVTAPVGTGKTMVLTERVRSAINAGILPEEILCLTFTNRAVEEMINRLKARINDGSVFDALTIKTFHGFCAYFIKTEAKEIGIDADFAIYDEDEQAEIMKEILADYPEVVFFGNDERRKILDLIENLYQYRLNQLERTIGCRVVDKKIEERQVEINEKYINALHELNAFDFNELVLMTIKTLYQEPKLQEKWSKKYKFIQLDEFQDTHMSEYLVVKELAKRHKNLAFIGDLDQTIYGWRGSEPYFIADLFRQHFAPVKELHLVINYRFNKNILEAIKSFLKSFAKANTKNIVTHDNSQEEKCVNVFSGLNIQEEVKWIIQNIKMIKDKEPEAKIAVLCRANNLINVIAKIFQVNKISHITVDKYDFFRRQEVRDILAYLKIIFNKFDLESVGRIVLRPARNIGPVTLENIRNQGSKIGLKVADFLVFRHYKLIEPFVSLIDNWRSGRIVVLDTETTGTNSLKDEIVQIYAVELINGRIGRDFQAYLKNTLPVRETSSIHGLTDEFLKKEGREPQAVLRDLKEFIGKDLILGYNINFDLSMMIENGKRHGLKFVINNFYDTLDIAKRFIKAENYKLATLARQLNLKTATHDARDDVLATVGLAEILIENLKKGHRLRIELFKKFCAKFIKLAILIHEWEDVVRKKRPKEALEHVWRASGLRDHYANEKDGERRLNSIDTLAKLFNELDQISKSPDIALRELINYAALVKNIDFLGLDQGKIPVVTVHQVKGLEFDYVFIPRVNEYRFPIMNSSLEEEKRLFYVAMTRAKNKIFISYSKFDDYNRPCARSQFIDYIDEKYVNLLN